MTDTSAQERARAIAAKLLGDWWDAHEDQMTDHAVDDLELRIARAIAAALTEAKRQTWAEAADLCESLGHYCGTNVQPAIAQITAEIRKRALSPDRGDAPERERP